MPLQKKSLLTLLIALIVAVVILFGTASIILRQSYSRLETFTAKQNVERVENTYTALIDQMKSTISDWSYWDDTYQFISDHNQEYIDENLPDDTLVYLGINFIQYVDGNGNVVFTKIVEFDGNGVTFSTTENIDLFHKFPSIFQSTEDDPQPSGIIYFDESPMLTVSSPVLHNDQSGPKNGTVLMERFLNQNMMDDLADQLNTRINFYPYPIDESNTSIVKISAICWRKGFYIHLRFWINMFMRVINFCAI